MAKEFKIGEDKIVFKGDIDAFNDFKQEYFQRVDYYFNEYITIVDEIKDFDILADNALSLGMGYFYKIFNSFGKHFTQKGYYDFSINYLTNHHMYLQVVEDYIEVCNILSKEKRNFNSYESTERMRRDIRKATRNRIVGGGFGIDGAIKGMVIAGMANSVTGLAHSAANAIGNARTKNKVQSAKEESYKIATCFLYDSFKSATGKLLNILMDYLDFDLEFDGNKSNQIVRNYSDGFLERDVVVLALRKAVELNPYNVDAYKGLLVTDCYNHNDILKIAEYFGIDLQYYADDMHTFDGKYFNDPIASIIAEDEAKEIIMNLGIGLDDFLEESFWLEQNVEFIDLAINAYELFNSKDDGDIPELKEYRNGKIAILKEIKEKVEKLTMVPEVYEKVIDETENNVQLAEKHIEKGIAENSSDELKNGLICYLEAVNAGRIDLVYTVFQIQSEHNVPYSDELDFSGAVKFILEGINQLDRDSVIAYSLLCIYESKYINVDYEKAWSCLKELPADDLVKACRMAIEACLLEIGHFGNFDITCVSKFNQLLAESRNLKLPLALYTIRIYRYVEYSDLDYMLKLALEVSKPVSNFKHLRRRILYVEGRLLELSSKGDYETLKLAYQKYLESANLGHLEAMCKIGWYFEKGFATEQSYERALDWYLKANERGSIFASLYVGNYCNYVLNDFNNALAWYEIAMSKSVKMAYYASAKIYGAQGNIQKHDEYVNKIPYALWASPCDN